MKTTLGKAMVCCVALLVFAAACSSSGNKASSSTSSSASDSTSSPDGSKGSIHIGTIADVTPGSLGTGEPEVALAAEAAVKAINAAGGINGRQLVLTVCDAKGDPNQTTACARNLAADKSIVALTGAVAATAPLEPVLQQSGLIDFGGYPISVDDLTSPVSFPFIGGPNALFLGAGALIAKNVQPTPTKVGFAYLGLPGFGAGAALINLPLAGVGASVTKSVSLPPGAPDISAQVASSTSGVDAVVVADTPAGEAQFVTTARKLNITTPIVLGAALSPAQISALGSAANGIYTVGSYRPATKDFAGGQEFLSETAQAGPGFINDEASVNAWLAVHVLADQLKKMTTITRASVFQAASEITGASTYGFTSNLDFTKPSTILGGKFPRVRNGAVFFMRIENGQLTLLMPNPFDVSTIKAAR